jgi:hypothetical protein
MTTKHPQPAAFFPQEDFPLLEDSDEESSSMSEDAGEE